MMVRRSGSDMHMNQRFVNVNQDRIAPGGGEPQDLPIENLTEHVRAASQSMCPIFANEPLYVNVFDALFRCLHKVVPRHILLVRERGVGERAVLLELARRGLQGDPTFLRGMQVLMLDCRRIVSNEMSPILTSFSPNGETPPNVVLCMDSFGNMLRNQRAFDYRSTMMSVLARTCCRVIGVISAQEFEECFSGDPDLRDCFSVLNLPEPSPPIAIDLVRHFAKGLELQFATKIEIDVIRQCVVLSDSFILSERLPHKALKILRSICEDIAYDRSQSALDRPCVTEEDVLAKVSQLTGIPARTLSGVGESIDYSKSVGELIVGQDHAVREVVTELNLIKAGMTDPNKPASVMMFIGQTGTGKTEMAKALARFYSSSRRLKTFTLGNFSEPHSVSGIIGVPPGYVGHDQGGRLVNELNADPYSVFLLDEADKAHPDVMQPFLNLFDEGWISDQRGVRAYASRAIFILTTNVGQRQIADMCKGGKSLEEITSTMKDSLSRIRHSKSNRPVFSAEFLARVKRIIVFKSLDRSAMLGICQRLVADLQSEWKTKRQKSLLISDDLIAAVATRASELDEKSQGREGGRIVRKLLADIVESPIQAAISASPDLYRRGHTVSVSFDQTPDYSGPGEFIRKCASAVRVQWQ